MSQQVAYRPGSSRRVPVALIALDPVFDQLLVSACRSVGDSTCGCTQVAIFGTLGAHDPERFWNACDARTAELALACGVEIWLAQEDAANAFRLRIEPCAPPDSRAEAPVDPAPERHAHPGMGWPALRRWWAGRRSGAAEEVGAAPSRR